MPRVRPRLNMARPASAEDWLHQVASAQMIQGPQLPWLRFECLDMRALPPDEWFETPKPMLIEAARQASAAIDHLEDF